VRGNEGEPIAETGLDVHFPETAARAEPAAVQKEALVVVRHAGGKGELAENREVDVCIATSNVLPMREFGSFGLQGSPELHQGVGAAHFLKGQHIRIYRAGPARLHRL
jgi:hypothetical protein